jgi:hypothetical protein
MAGGVGSRYFTAKNVKIEYLKYCCISLLSAIMAH